MVNTIFAPLKRSKFLWLLFAFRFPAPIAAGLLDEISILLGPGIDGRKGITSTFDGLPMNREPVKLKLEGVKAYDDGAVWLRYRVK